MSSVIAGHKYYSRELQLDFVKEEVQGFSKPLPKFSAVVTAAYSKYIM